MKQLLLRWKYRFIVWFRHEPDALMRRCKVELKLLAHANRNTSPTPEECRDMALQLGTPSWRRE